MSQITMGCSRTTQRFVYTKCNCTAPISQAVRDIPNAPCDPQLESIFFNKLPGEIRNAIYEFVLAEQESIPIDPSEPYYRPDYPSHRFFDTTLLRTCRRIYSEAYLIVPRNVQVLRFWLGNSTRAPPLVSDDDHRYGMDYRLYNELKSLPTSHRDWFPYVLPDPLIDRHLRWRQNLLSPNMSSYLSGHHDHSFSQALLPNDQECFITSPLPQRVQIFAQMYTLEYDHMRVTPLLETLAQSLSLKSVILTLRYTDWWNWETNETLNLHTRVLGFIKLPISVQTFELELETRNGKKAELLNILRNCESWTIGQYVYEGDEAIRSTRRFKFSGRKESQWIGSSMQTGYQYTHHKPEQNGTPNLSPDKMQFYIVKLSWIRGDD